MNMNIHIFPFISKNDNTFFSLEGFNAILEKYAKNGNKNVVKFYFEILKHKFFFTKIKYEYLRDVLDNKFLVESQREDFFSVFSAVQKCFSGFSRFIYLMKYKRSKTYNSVDLIGDPIQSKSRNTIVILQGGMKYQFILRELIKTINTSLSNSPYFFSEPVSCKNPYTNVPFNKSTLYNIYFAVKSSTYIMPVLFHQYFLANFDLYSFSLKNEVLVREYYVNSYVFNISDSREETIMEKVLTMFHDYRFTKLKISTDFPENMLLEIMHPYLDLYYKSKYYLQPQLRKHYSIILKYKLHEFIKFNPLFGRRYVCCNKINGESTMKREIKFNNRHPPFHLKNPEFSTSHLTSDSCILNQYRIYEDSIVYNPNVIFNVANNITYNQNHRNWLESGEIEEENESVDNEDEEGEGEEDSQEEDEDIESSDEEEENTLLPNEDDEEEEESEDESDESSDAES
jgi:hypothetical protein